MWLAHSHRYGAEAPTRKLVRGPRLLGRTDACARSSRGRTRRESRPTRLPAYRGTMERTHRDAHWNAHWNILRAERHERPSSTIAVPARSGACYRTSSRPWGKGSRRTHGRPRGTDTTRGPRVSSARLPIRLVERPTSADTGTEPDQHERERGHRAPQSHERPDWPEFPSRCENTMQVTVRPSRSSTWRSVMESPLTPTLRVQPARARPIATAASARFMAAVLCRWLRRARRTRRAPR